MKKKFKIGHKDLFNLNNLKCRNKNERKYPSQRIEGINTGCLKGA